ncbi:MAG: hypothetical protein HZC42_02465 [Candidatus Eisenbacteria bacterium]|nr:hypothetical protein [Candidatus Eisenbacteria bacterium]
MQLPRRRFLALIGVAVVASAAAMVVRRRRALRRWLRPARSAPFPPGDLDPPTVRTLMAAVHALLGERIESDHYEDFFRWRAAHVSGCRSLYAGFAASLDRAARVSGQRGFAGSPPALQRRILHPMLPVRGWARVWRRVTEPERTRLARLVVRDIFHLFARTDAWVLTGYDAWPGHPRGLEAYRQAPGQG